MLQCSKTISKAVSHMSKPSILWKSCNTFPIYVKCIKMKVTSRMWAAQMSFQRQVVMCCCCCCSISWNQLHSFLKLVYWCSVSDYWSYGLLKKIQDTTKRCCANGVYKPNSSATQRTIKDMSWISQRPFKATSTFPKQMPRWKKKKNCSVSNYWLAVLLFT